MNNPTKHAELIDRLHKQGVCVYLATEKSVADDLANGLHTAASTIEALDRDIAMREHVLEGLYEIREALGFNEFYPLSHLAGVCRELKHVIDEAHPGDGHISDRLREITRARKAAA